MTSLVDAVTNLSPLAILTGIAIPVVLWAYKLSSNVTAIRDNHLSHIEANTAESRDLLVELVAILKERGH